jgi:hypothetical protein
MWKFLLFLVSLIGAAPVCAQANKKADCCQCLYREVPRGCSPEGGVYFSADFLWWRAENHGLSAAFENQSESVSDGSIFRVSPAWDPGFRLGLGWNTSYDGWDLLLNWTWYENNASSTKTRNGIAFGSQQGFYPMWPHAHSPYGPFQTAGVTYRILYNAIDFEIGRAVFTSKKLSFRPFWGPRAAWLSQTFQTRFTTPLSNSADPQKSEGRDVYWGIGPRAGTAAEWHVGSGFSVVGLVAAAALYGNARVRFQNQELTNGAYVLERKFTDDFDQLAPQLQLLLGLQWGSCLWTDRYYLAFSAVWETNYWWDQMNLPVSLRSASFGSPMPTVGNQPVTLEGLTVNAEFDF